MQSQKETVRISFPFSLSSLSFAQQSFPSVSYLLFTIFHLGFYRFSTTLQAVICFHSLRQENELISGTCLKIKSPAFILFIEHDYVQQLVGLLLSLISLFVLLSYATTNYKETWVLSIYKPLQNTRHNQQLLHTSSVNGYQDGNLWLRHYTTTVSAITKCNISHSLISLIYNTALAPDHSAIWVYNGVQIKIHMFQTSPFWVVSITHSDQFPKEI